jgi:hypothetical protein
VQLGPDPTLTLVANSRFTVCSRANNSAGLLSRALSISRTSAVAAMVAEPLNSPPVSMLGWGLIARFAMLRVKVATDGSNIDRPMQTFRQSIYPPL